MPDYSSITNTLIQELVQCEKKIIASPSPKSKANGQHKETNIEMMSTDGKHKFSAFVRENINLVELFSVGLIYWPPSQPSIIVTRYNGNHGGHQNHLTKDGFDEGCHIHILKKEALDMGIKGENQAALTDKFATVNQAMRLFFEDLHVQNYADYYPELLQIELL